MALPVVLIGFWIGFGLRPEKQQLLAISRGSALFSQQRAFGPCTPGLTQVQARQRASLEQAFWQSTGWPLMSKLV